MTHIGNFDLKKRAAVVAVIGKTPGTLETSKKAAELGADILEIRLDLLGIRDAGEAAEIIRKIKAQTGLPILITSRSPAEGGKWEGSEAERIKLLTDLLSPAGEADAVDIELSAEKEERDKVIKAAKTAGKTIIVSFHDFSKTPSFQEMKTILEEAFLAGADIAKLAVMPQSMQDALDLLGVTLEIRKTGRDVCTIAMGRIGKHSRVIAPLYGSALTYASVEKAEAAAPGQLPVDEVKKMMELLE